MFESLGKKLSDFGTVAAKKTKDIGNTVSLTAKIEAAKRELTGVYAQLGQKFYQAQQDEIPEEYAALFDKIARTEQTLDEYQAQRQVLRRVRPCPDCGADVPNDDAYCAKCGSHVGVVVTEEDITAGDIDDEDIFEPEDTPVEDIAAEAKDVAEKAADTAEDVADEAKDLAEEVAAEAEELTGE